MLNTLSIIPLKIPIPPKTAFKNYHLLMQALLLLECKKTLKKFFNFTINTPFQKNLIPNKTRLRISKYG
ncbi:hypothetical protein HPSA50_0789 [Helicobacter pylori SouthAfrica50]|uniref:Uncharacterized protein n=1 Tax=Helicobacter pylori SouthAfrica50 TaxID=1352357 RepID=T2S761_HELPX|nr:hypothetical protein HPSA50_0789 [Helicobacter pylori SouthAfrica50]